MTTSELKNPDNWDNNAIYGLIYHLIPRYIAQAAITPSSGSEVSTLVDWLNKLFYKIFVLLLITI